MLYKSHRALCSAEAVTHNGAIVLVLMLLWPVNRTPSTPEPIIKFQRRRSIRSATIFLKSTWKSIFSPVFSGAGHSRNDDVDARREVRKPTVLRLQAPSSECDYGIRVVFAVYRQRDNPLARIPQECSHSNKIVRTNSLRCEFLFGDLWALCSAPARRMGERITILLTHSIQTRRIYTWLRGAIVTMIQVFEDIQILPIRNRHDIPRPTYWRFAFHSAICATSIVSLLFGCYPFIHHISLNVAANYAIYSWKALSRLISTAFNWISCIPAEHWTVCNFAGSSSLHRVHSHSEPFQSMVASVCLKLVWRVAVITRSSFNAFGARARFFDVRHCAFASLINFHCISIFSVHFHFSSSYRFAFTPFRATHFHLSFGKFESILIWRCAVSARCGFAL